MLGSELETDIEKIYENTKNKPVFDEGLVAKMQEELSDDEHWRLVQLRIHKGSCLFDPSIIGEYHEKKLQAHEAEMLEHHIKRCIVCFWDLKYFQNPEWYCL